MATAHKIARIVDHLLKYGDPYREEAAAVYEHQRRERDLRQLSRRAAKLGHTLTPTVQTASDAMPEIRRTSVSREHLVGRQP